MPRGEVSAPLCSCRIATRSLSAQPQPRRCRSLLIAAAPPDVSSVFIELGAATLGLALLSRFGSRFGFSAIPLYLLAGLAFGNGGLLPLAFSKDFVHVGAEIGVVLLLFMLGLEYTGSELTDSLRTGVRGGVIDFVLNFSPGAIAGLILGW